MGNTCPGSRMSDSDADAAMYRNVDRVRVQPSKRTTLLRVQDTPDEQRTSRPAHGSEFRSTYDPSAASAIPIAVLVEHYQPYEFPICPVINSDTQRLVRESWRQIMTMQFDSDDVGSGKVSGASYFYNHFFTHLFSRLDDFTRIFPDIKSRADIFSKVMGFCISIRIEELELVKAKLKHLGQMHRAIIHHPYLFGIYASNMHSTIRHCLGDQASHEIMSAWLHLLSFILRGMLPAYFAGSTFTGHYNGAVNAVSAINEKARDEVKATEEMRLLKTRLQTVAHTEPPSQLGDNDTDPLDESPKTSTERRRNLLGGAGGNSLGTASLYSDHLRRPVSLAYGVGGSGTPGSNTTSLRTHSLDLPGTSSRAATRQIHITANAVQTPTAATHQLQHVSDEE